MLAATRVAQMAKKMPPKVRGQVERSISPYEQSMFGDLMDVPLLLAKARRKVGDNLLSVTPGVLAFCRHRHVGQLVPRKVGAGAALLRRGRGAVWGAVGRAMAVPAGTAPLRCGWWARAAVGGVAVWARERCCVAGGWGGAGWGGGARLVLLVGCGQSWGAPSGLGNRWGGWRGTGAGCMSGEAVSMKGAPF
eukprot:TRINITY_DN1944_c0_g1_i7.p1 TRINITY_DN1944_c0_g1~~TRINITY_DN1944_c0_g1_i7.p1  ORF type:complete len:223 (-),score=12.89 TRINITY_DN1944_c0_g1_i7:110-685(-)